LEIQGVCRLSYLQSYDELQTDLPTEHSFLIWQWVQARIPWRFLEINQSNWLGIKAVHVPVSDAEEFPSGIDGGVSDKSMIGAQGSLRDSLRDSKKRLMRGPRDA
jgi:hypothetical protein